MNRIFHARIAWYQYFLLVVLTVNAVGALWCKYILVAVLFMLMLIVVIEQIIHTTYTLTTMVIWKSHVAFYSQEDHPAFRNYCSQEIPFHEIRPFLGDGLYPDRIRKRKVCFGDACQGTGICRTTRKENV